MRRQNQRKRLISVAAALLFLAQTPDTKGDINITATESGGNTTISFSGSLDTSGAVGGVGPGPVGFGELVSDPPNFPNDTLSFFGAAGATVIFNSAQTGFGGGDFAAIPVGFNFIADGGSGDTFLLIQNGNINLPLGYVANSDISGSIVYNGQSLASLGLDPNTQLIFSTNFGNIIFFPQTTASPIRTIDIGAINSANTTGVFIPNAQSTAQNDIVNTTLSALHNQRIVRARSQMGNPRAESTSLANSDRMLTRYLAFSRTQDMTLRQALGLEDVPAGLVFNDDAPKAGRLLTVEQKAGAKVSAIEEPRRWEIYAVGDSGNFDQDALNLVNRGFQSRTLTGSVGVEYYVNPHLNVGAAYTYAENDTDLDEGLGNVDIEGQLTSVYATAFNNGRYFDALYTYGSYENQVRRNTLTPGGFATGSPDSDSHTFSLNAGQNFEYRGLVTGPTLGFDYTSGKIDSYSETGGGTAALNYQEREYRSAISSLGWQVSKSQEVKHGVLTLQAFASWEHEFDPEAGNVRASLATSPFAINGLATGGFNINQPGAAPGTDWMSLGVGARLVNGKGWGIEVDYQTQLFRDDVEAHYIGAKFSGQF